MGELAISKPTCREEKSQRRFKSETVGRRLESRDRPIIEGANLMTLLMASIGTSMSFSKNLSLGLKEFSTLYCKSAGCLRIAFFNSTGLIRTFKIKG